MDKTHLSGCFCSNGINENINIKYLYTWIKENGVMKVASPGIQGLENSGGAIFSIESGTWRLFIGERKVISIVGPGSIVWLNKFTENHDGPSYKCEIVSHSIYYELPEESLHLGVADKSLLKGAFDFMKLNTNNISNKWLSQCLNDKYTHVKSALEQINEMPSSIKSKFSVISLITDTTGVSRSHALAIMKSLKAGKYIETDGGYFVRILKKLPVGY